MRTLTSTLLMFLVGCSGGVALTDSTAPDTPGPTGGRPLPGPRDGGADTTLPDGGPSASPDAGPVAGDPSPAPDAGPPTPPPPPTKVSIFPPDSPWNTRIDDAPVDPKSDAYIADMGADDPLTAAWDADGDGIPYVEVGREQAMVHISYWGYPKESDPGPFPIPWDAQPDPSLDHHVIVVDRERGFLYELFKGSRNSDGSW